jgi:hypothetical protein
MTRFVDARIPVVFGAPGAAGAEDVVLLEGEGAGPARWTHVAAGHPAGCACCKPRGAAAEALGRLFLARARGEVPFFRRVVASGSPDAQAALAEAVANDPVASAYFRLVDRS